MSQFLFGDGSRVVDFVTENQERNLGEFFNGEKSIELGLGFGKSLRVGRVNEEDNAVYFREVILPESSSL